MKEKKLPSSIILSAEYVIVPKPPNTPNVKRVTFINGNDEPVAEVSISKNIPDSVLENASVVVPFKVRRIRSKIRLS